MYVVAPPGVERNLDCLVSRFRQELPWIQNSDTENRCGSGGGVVWFFVGVFLGFCFFLIRNLPHVKN